MTAGAPPMIPLARPCMGDEEAAAAIRVIRSGWMTQGPEVAAFEQEFAAAVGARHACAVSSCTSALHVALVALGIGPGDEVITVSHSFIATANAVRYSGATVVFVDVDPVTGNIDPARIGPAMTARTRAVLCVHQLGMPCDLPAILGIARAHGLRVIEDAACAAGSEIHRLDDGADRWERIGRPHGDVACFSFHPRKILSTGDGGMLTTNDPALDERFRLLRQHGMSVSDAARHGATRVVDETYPVLGFNYRMTDIQAAIGREQLKRLPAIVGIRRARAARYHDALARIPGITPPAEPHGVRTNWQSYAIRLAPSLDRRALMQRLLDAGIATRRGVMNAHREEAYPSGAWTARGSLSNSELLRETSIILPLYHDMTDAEQDRVVDAIASALRTS